MQPKDEDKKKCGNGKISIRRLKSSKNIVKLIFQNMIGKTFCSTNLALLAGGPKTQVLNPELPVFGVGIYGHPEANMGEFGRNHVFVMRFRFAPILHHL